MNILCLKSLGRDSYLQSFIENKKINFFISNIYENKKKIIEIIDSNNIKFILIILYSDISYIYDKLKINKIYPNIKFIFFHHGLLPKHQMIIKYDFKKYKLHGFLPNNEKNNNIHYNSKEYCFPIYGSTTIDLLRNKINNRSLIKLKYNINKNLKSILFIDRPEIEMKYFYYLFNYCLKYNYNIFICIHPKKKNKERFDICNNKLNILKYINKKNNIDKFVKNNFFLISNLYLYDIIAYCNLVFCPLRTSCCIELLASNKKTIYFLNQMELREIDKKSIDDNLSNIKKWIKNPKLEDYDSYYFNQFNYPILSLNDFKNIDNILNDERKIKKYLDTKKEKNKILEKIYGNKYKIENTTDRIINRLYKL